MSDYKLILISDNSEKTRIRYRKKNDRNWNTLYLEETDFEKVIDQLLTGVVLNGPVESND